MIRGRRVEGNDIGEETTVENNDEGEGSRGNEKEEESRRKL